MWDGALARCVALFLTAISLWRAAPVSSLAERRWKGTPLSVWRVSSRWTTVDAGRRTDMSTPAPKNTCSKCGDSYKLGSETAILHIFTKHPGMSYLAATCPIPACEHDELVFFIPGGYKLSEMEEFGFDKVAKDEPDEWVFTIYNKVTDSRPVKLYDELTPNQERVLRVAAFDMEDATPEDIINGVKGKHPIRWD